MQAIEFNSVVRDGVIFVPGEYRNMFSTVKVILLATDSQQDNPFSQNESFDFSEFEKKWAGAFKVSDADYDNLKYEYLKEKYQ
jgi:hypothetical protein